ncbi:endonuclease domain-containing protein [Acinetobacter sp.]|uniref:endonuclease domain-containing protein n=1 Tax=Acinetobacter sp. TaxID=472 RepID=UPI00388D8900
MKLTDYTIERNDGRSKCPICEKWFKSLGLASHFHKTHNPNFKNPTDTKPIWNKGLDKSDPRVAESGRKCSAKTKGRKGPPMKAEQKIKIARSMEQAHAEGRAHNIGSSRWNNEPSWPEKFFIQVIENEFEDKNAQREFPFKRYSLDFAWVEKKLCIEIDGAQHQRFEEYKARDARKDLALREEGWDVLRIKWSDLYTDTKKWIKIAHDFIHKEMRV